MKELVLVAEIVTPVSMKYNKEEISKFMEMVEYKVNSLDFTEENLKEISEVRISLSKLEKELKIKSKELKEKADKPIKDFIEDMEKAYKKTKELYIKCKNFEDIFAEKEREEKRNKIEMYIKEILVNTILEDKYKIKIIVEEKMINKSVSFKSIKEYINNKIEILIKEQEQEKQLELLKKEKEELERIQKEKEIKEKLEKEMKIKQQLEIEAARERIRLENEKKLKEEKEKIEKELTEKIKKEMEEEKKEIKTKEVIENKKVIETNKEEKKEIKKEKTETIVLKFENLTKSNALKMLNYFKENDIKFEKTDEITDQEAEDLRFYCALQNAGVESWEGYEIAQEMIEEWDNE